MTEHLPVLVIIIPLVLALIAPVAGRLNRIYSWAIALLATLFSFVGSVLLLHQVMYSGAISYWMGGWEPPWGIEYVIDYFSGFVLVIVSFLAVAVTIFARKSVADEIDEKKIPAFYGVYLLFIVGLMGMIVTGDIFNLYVFLEISSLTGYALVAMGKRRKAPLAGFRYLVIGTVGATFILLGIGYLYIATGTLNMADLGARLPGLFNSKLVITAFAFFAIGFSIKIALFPLHTWLPDAYTYAPSAVSALMASTGTKVGAYSFIRIIFTVFGVQVFLNQWVSVPYFFLIIASVAMLVGSILAIAQTNIKKMLAYSSVSQIGYIILGVALMNPIGLQGGLLHIFNHALMKCALFMSVGCIAYKTGITNIADLKGLGFKKPYSMVAFTAGALSMIGIPLTVGFVSKWYLAMGSLENGMWYLIPVIVISSVLMLVYFWRVIDNIFFKAGDAVKMPATPASMLIPTVVVAALCLVFGTLAFIPVNITGKAVLLLFG
ncbi:MAG: monovalent cation/H+ antiporter subunit D family protein [Syntrophomonadaceae bacterium]|nr:monovalent cation/H+ antiporter subunit D family protein [Syntrophomonadaceae bacterium]